MPPDKSPTGFGWDANMVVELIFVTTTDKDGNTVRIPIKKRRVELVKDGRTMSFKVGTGQGGFPVFTDTRLQATGAAPLTNRGPLPGDQYNKPGPVKKLTPTAWANEVERYIGPAGIGQIFIRLAHEGFKLSS